MVFTIGELTPLYEGLSSNIPLSKAPYFMLNFDACRSEILKLWDIKFAQWSRETDVQDEHFLYWIDDASESSELTANARYDLQAFVRHRRHN